MPKSRQLTAKATALVQMATMWREGVLTRIPVRRAVTREHHLHVLFRVRRTLADIGEGRGGIDGATDACICHGDVSHPMGVSPSVQDPPCEFQGRCLR